MPKQIDEPTPSPDPDRTEFKLKSPKGTVRSSGAADMGFWGMRKQKSYDYDGGGRGLTCESRGWGHRGTTVDEVGMAAPDLCFREKMGILVVQTGKLYIQRVATRDLTVNVN